MTQTNISDFSNKTQSQTSEESNRENDNTDREESKRTEFSLDGLRANDPLAFLAAVGTVRALDSAETTERSKLSWTRVGSNWTPTLHVKEELSREQLLDTLIEYLTDDQKRDLIDQMEEEMEEAAENLEFERAAELRDSIEELEEELGEG